jgi:hypothetical protein
MTTSSRPLFRITYPYHHQLSRAQSDHSYCDGAYWYFAAGCSGGEFFTKDIESVVVSTPVTHSRVGSGCVSLLNVDIQDMLIVSCINEVLPKSFQNVVIFRLSLVAKGDVTHRAFSLLACSCMPRRRRPLNVGRSPYLSSNILTYAFSHYESPLCNSRGANKHQSASSYRYHSKRIPSRSVSIRIDFKLHKFTHRQDSKHPSHTSRPLRYCKVLHPCSSSNGRRSSRFQPALKQSPLSVLEYYSAT